MIIGKIFAAFPGGGWETWGEITSNHCKTLVAMEDIHEGFKIVCSKSLKSSHIVGGSQSGWYNPSD